MPATHSRRIPVCITTVARSSATRSRAAPARYSGRRTASTGITTGRSPHLPLEDLKARLGTIADFVYGHPSRDLWMVGVTGTNGKTSCAHWIAAGLQAGGRKHGGAGHARQRLAGRPLTGDQHHARRGIAARDACLAQARGRGGGGDGSLLARARSGARQRRRVRCRAVHQPLARSSRLPRHHGSVRRGEGEAPFVAGRARRRDQCRRPLRSEPDRVRTSQRAQGADLWFLGGGHRRIAADADCRGSRFRRRDSVGQGRTRDRGSSAHSTPPTFSACSAFCWSVASSSTRRSGSSPNVEGAPGTDATQRRRLRAAGRRRLRPYARMRWRRC